MNIHLLFILLGNASLFKVASSRPAVLSLFKNTASTKNLMQEIYQYTQNQFQGAHEPLKHPLQPRTPAASARTIE